MELVAHRAANAPESIGEASRVADTLELDVHTFRGRLEVRHAKVVWPFRIYWERGVGLTDERPHPLASVLAATPSDVALWVDLKGFTGRFARRVVRQVGDERPITVSGRSWWALRPAHRMGIRTFRSVGNRAQLWLALRIRHPHGVVMHERFATTEHLGRLDGRCSAVAVWGVADRARAIELRDAGLAALILDDLDLIGDLGESSHGTAGH